MSLIEEVTHVAMSGENNPIRIIVKFDNQAVGLKAILSSSIQDYISQLKKHETTFLLSHYNFVYNISNWMMLVTR